jgi:HK97 family phage major capsid protein
MEAKWSLKLGYWNAARWLFHRDIAKQIAKEKDGDGNYLWRENVRVGEPDTLLGRPAFISERAPNTATTGLYVGILGDFFRGYWIADALDMEMQRLDELNARTNQVEFIGRLKTDGMPVLEEAFSRVTLA